MKIRKIEFYGNTHFSNKKLKKTIFLKKRHEFEIRQFKIDKILLKNLYLNNGFLNVWIEEEYTKKEKGFYLKFNISEGRRFYFDSLLVEGNQYISSNKINSFFRKVKKSDFYNQILVDEAINNLENYYYDKGYPNIKLVHSLSFDTDSLVFVNLTLNEGPRVLLTGIELFGIHSIKEYVVKREIDLEPGEYYSRSKINEIQRRLYGTGLFETVNIQVSPNKKDSTKAKLFIQVNEKKMRFLGVRTGIGYEENTSFGATLNLTGEFGHLNLFNRGRAFTASAIPSLSYDFTNSQIVNPQNQFSVRYFEPWLFRTRTPTIFQIGFIQRQPVNSADYDFWTYSLQFKRELSPKWNLTTTTEYQYITNITGAEQDAERDFFLPTNSQKVYSINNLFMTDKRNNIMAPTKGYLTEAGIGFIRSENPGGDSLNIAKTSFYTKINVGWNRYQPFLFFDDWVLASRIKASYIHLLKKNSIISITDRLTLGGASTIRGYQEQLVGVLDESKTIAIGGKISFLSNIELRIPVINFIYFTTFFDMGNVWWNVEDMKISDLRMGTGAGLAFNFQIIILRFDYGFKVSKKSYEKHRGLPHFGVSFAF